MRSARSSARYTVVYQTRPAKIGVSRHFSLSVAVCAKSGAPAPDALRVDARMPEHGHGMNYTADGQVARSRPLRGRRPDVPYARTLGTRVRRAQRRHRRTGASTTSRCNETRARGAHRGLCSIGAVDRCRAPGPPPRRTLASCAFSSRGDCSASACTAHGRRRRCATPATASRATGAPPSLARDCFSTRACRPRGNISCASCHIPESGWSDARARARPGWKKPIATRESVRQLAFQPLVRLERRQRQPVGREHTPAARSARDGRRRAACHGAGAGAARSDLRLSQRVRPRAAGGR